MVDPPRTFSRYISRVPLPPEGSQLRRRDDRVITGTSQAMIRRYSRFADQKKLAKAAIPRQPCRRPVLKSRLNDSWKTTAFLSGQSPPAQKDARLRCDDYWD